PPPVPAGTTNSIGLAGSHAIEESATMTSEARTDRRTLLSFIVRSFTRGQASVHVRQMRKAGPRFREPGPAYDGATASVLDELRALTLARAPLWWRRAAGTAPPPESPTSPTSRRPWPGSTRGPPRGSGRTAPASGGTRAPAYGRAPRRSPWSYRSTSPARLRPRRAGRCRSRSPTRPARATASGRSPNPSGTGRANG